MGTNPGSSSGVCVVREPEPVEQVKEVHDIKLDVGPRYRHDLGKEENDEKNSARNRTDDCPAGVQKN
jgi:hypothetical protein